MEKMEKKEEKKERLLKQLNEYDINDIDKNNLILALETNVWCLPVTYKNVTIAFKMLQRNPFFFPLTWDLYNMLSDTIKKLPQNGFISQDTLFTLNYNLVEFCVDLGCNSDRRLCHVEFIGGGIKYYIEPKLGCLYSGGFNNIPLINVEGYVQRWMITTT